MVSNTRLAVVGALFGAAQANNWANTTGVAWTTEVVTELTTFCPSPTTLTHGDKTYTVTEPTTLTITDCPCTISKPVEPTSEVVYTTEVVTELTTFCPSPTTLTHGDKTYTVTEPTTLTITDCPCTISKPVEPTHTPEPTSPPKDECAEKCTKAYNECRIAPDANMAYCGAQYAKCLNFNPFDGSNKTVTACSGEPVYTTEVVTHLTTYCPEPTTLTLGHSTYTVTEPTTLTVSDCSCTISKPVETHPVPTKPAADCPEECMAAYNKCRGAAGSNKATCASEYASCLGFNPFNNNGTLVTPTACSQGPKPTATQPTPGQPGTPGQPPADCPEECTAAYRECQTGPDANQSFCASQIAQCLGYNPFENGSFVTPTACSAQPPKTTLQPSATAPGNPGTPGTPGTPETPETPGSPSSVPTAAADHLSPLKALGVIAAIAML